MREPTREEWSDWASAGRAKEPKSVADTYYLGQLAYRNIYAEQQYAALQGIQSIGMMQLHGMGWHGHCPTCGHRPSVTGGIFGSIFG